MGFARFMASPLGRLIRIVAGLALVFFGVRVMGGTGGWTVAVIGLVPLFAGALDFCVFAPLFGGPFQGRKARSA